MQVKPVQNYQASPKAKNSNNPTSPNTSLVETKKIEAPANTDREVGLIKNDIYPLTIESIVNSYKHIRQRKKLSWQVYFTPTVSYRRLKENKKDSWMEPVLIHLLLPITPLVISTALLHTNLILACN
ncbi:MAG: hypothetical protein IPO53_12605 [Chitinophagaceae bacterium]|nr:hypothetical protein [Chitinophagaceae bacterium]